MLVCLTILVSQGGLEWQAYSTQVWETESSVANLASSLAQDAEDTIEIADTAVASVAAWREIDGTSPEGFTRLSQKLAAQVSTARRLQDIILLGANGDWLATSASIKPTNFADREYFRHHRDNPDLGPFIGAPIRSRLNGRWIITVSRRIQSMDGGFAGVALATIDLSYFTDHYATYGLGPNSSIGLSATDGTLLVRYPSNEQFVGRNILTATIFTKLREHSAGAFASTGLTDGVRRIVGYRQIDQYPLVVWAAMSEDNVLGAWRADMRIHMLIAIVTVGIIGLLAQHLIRQVGRSQAAEGRARQSEERYRLLAENSNDLVTRVGPDGLWHYVSPASQRIIGLPPGTLLGLKMLDFAHPDDRQSMLDRVARLMTGKNEEQRPTFRILRPDGIELWIEASSQVILQPVTGAPDGYVSVMRDVTERVAMETALRENEVRYRLLAERLREANDLATLALDSGAIGIWDWDVLNDKMVWNRRMYQLLGMQGLDETPSYAMWRRYLHPDDCAVAEQEVRDALKATEPYNTEFRVVWDDDSVHHIRASGRVTRDAGGSAIRISGANWDVTNLRIEEEQRAMTIIQAAPNGMMIVDETGVIILANSQAARLFEYPAGTLVGQLADTLVPGAFHVADGVLLSAFTDVKPGDQATMPGREFIRRNRNGSETPIEIMLSTVKTPRGRIIVASLFDVTERKRRVAEKHESEMHARELVEATNASLEKLARHLTKARDRAEQANRAKSRFLAGMSHELRTPLNGILGYAQMLQLEGGLSQLQTARVDSMLAAGKHLLEMITCVLDLSEIEAEHVVLRAVEVDVQAIAAASLDLVRPTAEAKGLALSLVVIPGTPRQLVVDSTRLRQVLLNLLGNAVKFTAQGAVELRLQAEPDGLALRIEVIDTGDGIPAEQRQRLFNDFERLDTKATFGAEGAGLGLAVSARLAALMGGRLGHDDRPSGGSVFWLELPLNTPATSCPTSAQTNDVPDGETESVAKGTFHVLVVDDVLINLDIASSFLGMGGHTVTCADSGAKAVAAVSGTDFDVVLMDVRMPQMDGLEATRRIRALGGARAQVPIVALTAQAFTDQVAACREAGMDSHMAKPFDPETLLAAVARAVSVKRKQSKESSPVSMPTTVAAGATNRWSGMELQLLAPKVFERIAAVLKPDAVTSYLQTIAALAQTLLLELRATKIITGNDELVEATHKLVGTAGMFGFERLAAVGRNFERAILSGAAEAPTLADAFCKAIEDSLKEMTRINKAG